MKNFIKIIKNYNNYKWNYFTIQSNYDIILRSFYILYSNRRRETMKKLLKFGIAMVATLALSLTAMAAPSPSGTASATGRDSAGNAVTISVADSSQSVTIADAASLAGLNANTTRLLGVYDITAPGLDVPPVTITMNMAGVTATSKIAVLHYVNGAWVNVPATAGNGTVTFTVDTLSPFAFFVEGGTATTTSPKTGQSSVASIAVLGLATLAAAYVVSRKKVA